MEIVRRKNEGCRFKVVRSFFYHGKAQEIGGEIELEEPAGTGFVLSGRVVPNLPEVAQYVCVQDITLPGRVTAFKAKRNEIVEVRAADALDLLKAGRIVPVNDLQWRPHQRLK